jgi:multicomponent Na+:H+ antiporter subunit E
VTLFAWKVFLAFVWASATGQFSVTNLMVGYALGFAVLWFSRFAVGPARHFRRAWNLLSLLLYFLKELAIANFRVAYDVVTPTFRMKPAIVGIPLDATSDAEITLLANMLTMTPGTLTLDVSPDRRTLYIHAMFVSDAEAVRRDIKKGFEKRILEVLR